MEGLSMALEKSTAIRQILGQATGIPTIFTTGYTSRIGAAIGDRPNHFYMTGSMGMALPIGLGIAMTTNRPTLVIDGDGSLLMNPSMLVSAGACKNLPLVHVVLDDGCYASTGGQTSAAGNVDLVAWALAAGYPSATAVSTSGGLAKAMETALSPAEGLTFVRCLVRPDSAPPPPRIAQRLDTVAKRFADVLRT
jgi:thiamine pyrophosphate-dependent acetolactate synthase large subunit-like protein